MITTYSIAEVRNQFASLIRDAEANNQPVQVTRRGLKLVIKYVVIHVFI